MAAAYPGGAALNATEAPGRAPRSHEEEGCGAPAGEWRASGCIDATSGILPTRAGDQTNVAVRPGARRRGAVRSDSAPSPSPEPALARASPPGSAPRRWPRRRSVGVGVGVARRRCLLAGVLGRVAERRLVGVGQVLALDVCVRRACPRGYPRRVCGANRMRRGITVETPKREVLPMAGKLEGKTIAFLVATEGVEQVELTEPWKAVEEAGGTPELVSLEAGEVQALQPPRQGRHVHGRHDRRRRRRGRLRRARAAGRRRQPRLPAHRRGRRRRSCAPSSSRPSRSA